METGLRKKTAIVTGATANIGRAIALSLAAEGVRLAVVGRDYTKGEEIARQAREAGADDAMFIAADVTNRHAVTHMVTEVLERLGPVDVLVNNVGGNTKPFGLFVESDPDDWQADIDLNLKTTLLCCHAVLPHMIARKRGRIINIGSTAGEVGDYMLSVYSAAKGGVHTFTRVLAREVGEHNITVNCVAPYGTLPDDPAHTSSGSRFHPESGVITKDPNLGRVDLQGKLLRDGVLSRRFAKPFEVAAGVVYLASETAGFVTGQIHFIEGGALLLGFSMFEELKIGTAIYGFPLFSSAFSEAVNFIKTADTLGFGYLRFYDHVLGNAPDPASTAQQSPYSSASTIRECFTFMAYIAAVTSRIELTAGVIVLPQRQTALVAKQAAEIDIMSNGRLTLGVGVGYNKPEFLALGTNFADRAALFEEQIHVLRLLWAEEIANYKGKFHNIENLGLAPRPPRRKIPIFFGVGRAAAPIPRDIVLERCGRLADGWMPSILPDEDGRAAVAKVAEAARAAGRDPNAITLELNLPVQDKTANKILESINRYRDFGARRINLQLPGKSAAEQIEDLKRMAEILRLE